MIIRSERQGDDRAIARVVELAFGRADEGLLVDRLRTNGDAVISLVADHEGAILGHVMFSRMAAPFRALGLAPVSVTPARQHSGVGKSLVLDGLKQARAQSWAAVFVLGDPAYYERFGFRAALASGFSSPYAGPHFMALPLEGPLPVSTGKVEYAPAFANLK